MRILKIDYYFQLCLLILACIFSLIMVAREIYFRGELTYDLLLVSTVFFGAYLVIVGITNTISNLLHLFKNKKQVKQRKAFVVLTALYFILFTIVQSFGQRDGFIFMLFIALIFAIYYLILSHKAIKLAKEN